MINSLYPLFKLDSLNGFVVLAISLFSVLISIYSWRFFSGLKKTAEGGISIIQYYIYIVLTLICAIGAVTSNDLILLIIFWGFMGLTLYLLINAGGSRACAAAKKTFIIVGGTDALMLLGACIIYTITKTTQIDLIDIELNNGLAVFAYLCIAIACFSKAGAMPFHSWIPDSVEYAPVPVAAYLPASLDKLLGIYLLARISLDMFVMNTAMGLFLMAIGAFTIIAAVMMALVQHNMKRLLGYHAVSQVGYMILGIGTGIPIGIAGGIFHMLNHSLYKSCLFLTSGNVEYREKTVELDELGGLSRLMPITYISCFIASLSIAGIPPLNGFVSKWMIYQGVIGKWQIADSKWQVIVYILCLAAAMFGSGLTLASFIKLLHAVFLGRRAPDKQQSANEVHWQMWLPCSILAVICVLFGIFAYQLPLKYFILPAVDSSVFIGSWFGGLATSLMAAGFLVGVFIFKLKGLKTVFRKDEPFIGAEDLNLEETRVTGTEFYNTVREYGIFKNIYDKAQKGYFDIYEQGKSVVFGMGRFLQYLHNGVLPSYLVWALLGMAALFIISLR